MQTSENAELKDKLKCT